MSSSLLIYDTHLSQRPPASRVDAPSESASQNRRRCWSALLFCYRDGLRTSFSSAVQLPVQPRPTLLSARSPLTQLLLVTLKHSLPGSGVMRYVGGKRLRAPKCPSTLAALQTLSSINRDGPEPRAWDVMEDTGSGKTVGTTQQAASRSAVVRKWEVLVLLFQ